MWQFCNSKGGLVVQAQMASEVMIKSSLVRTTGEGAKMAGVPQKTGIATAKNGPIRLDVVIIQESLGRRESEARTWLNMAVSIAMIRAVCQMIRSDRWDNW